MVFLPSSVIVAIVVELLRQRIEDHLGFLVVHFSSAAHHTNMRFAQVVGFFLHDMRSELEELKQHRFAGAEHTGRIVGNWLDFYHPRSPLT